MGCLCLTRKKSESILIGENQEIEVVIVEIQQSASGKAQVKLCIIADEHIPIVRKELLTRMEKNSYEKIISSNNITNLGISFPEPPSCT